MTPFLEGFSRTFRSDFPTDDSVHPTLSARNFPARFLSEEVFRESGPRLATINASPGHTGPA